MASSSVQGAKQFGKTAAEQGGLAATSELLESGTKFLEEQPVAAITVAKPSAAVDIIGGTAKLAGKAVKGVAKGTAEVSAYAVSQATGLERSTLSAAIKNENLPKFRQMGEEAAAKSLYDNAVSAIENKAAEVSEG